VYLTNVVFVAVDFCLFTYLLSFTHSHDIITTLLYSCLSLKYHTHEHKIMKERRIAMEQAALRDKMAQQQTTDEPTVDFATTPSSFVSSRKKPSAAERIGYRKGSGGGAR
jgi:hypothetical protein